MATSFTFFKRIIFFLFLLLVLAFNSFAAGGGRDSLNYYSFSQASHRVMRRPVMPRHVAVTADTTNSYKRFTGIKFSGYVRGFAQYRDLPVRYPEVTSQHQLVVNGYDATNRVLTSYPEPTVWINAEARPLPNTYVRAVYAFDDLLIRQLQNGSGTVPSANKNGSPYRVMQFEAGTQTKFGDFKIIAGGPLVWYKLSPMTLYSYQYRTGMFDRLAWEPQSTAYGRYNKYYETGNTTGNYQWGYTGFQGFVLEGTNLPKGFAVNLLYGRTDNTGGFQTTFVGSTKNMGAGRIEKSINATKIGVNAFDQTGFSDSAANFKLIQQIVTGDIRTTIKGIKIYVEGGAGRYQDSIVQRSGNLAVTKNGVHSTEAITAGSIIGLNYKWAPAVNFDVDFGKNIVKFPIALQGYYIDKSVVNINSQMLNTANPHTATGVDLTTYQGGVADIGQMANNRWAGTLKHENTYGRLKVIAAINAGQEINNLFNEIYYQHRAAAYPRSRFSFYNPNAGPYGRIKSVYRRTFEMIRITDVDPNYKKGYNMLDLTLKYKTSLFNKDFIICNYNNYTSVQQGFSPVPIFTSYAFLRTFYEELTGFYSLSQRLTVIGLGGFEKDAGNNRTELADANGNLITDTKGNPVASPNGKPIDQRDWVAGAGFDYNIKKNIGFFYRFYWYTHTDKDFTKDKFQGTESSVELKVFF